MQNIENNSGNIIGANIQGSINTINGLYHDNNSKPEYNKKDNNIRYWVALVLSCVSIVLSIITLSFSFPNYGNLDFDYQGILVSVLSLLITVLIGWQLFNIVGLENKFNKIESDFNKLILIKISDFNKLMIEKVEKAQNIPIGVSLAQLGLTLYNRDDYAEATQIFFNAISVLLDGLENEYKSEIGNDSLQKSIEFLKLISQKQLPISVEHDSKMYFIKIASKLSDKELIDFATKITGRK